MTQKLTITKVDPILLSAQHGDHPKHLPTGFRAAGLVRIECSDGTTGLGESYLGVYAPEVYRAFIEHFRPYLVGENPLEIEAVMKKLRRQCLWWGWTGASISALSAIDIALWDIKGKVANAPVYALLNEKRNDQIPLYASGGTPKPPEELRREMEQYLNEGYRAIKIRIGPWRQNEAEKTGFVRDVVGPEVKLMVDAVQSINQPPWTGEEACHTAKTLEPYDPFWLEEPCGSFDINGYALVRKTTSIPVAGGESLTTAESFKMFFEADALGIAQPDATHVGGISDCFQVCLLGHERQVPMALHAWGTAICMAANYHVGFAVPNCLILERPALDNPLIPALLREEFRVQEGYLRPPSAPGLGVELTEETLTRYAYRPGSAYQI
jgi:L-alanine-DL-glutamate epimerase-like enolase superfamily enzyme